MDQRKGESLFSYSITRPYPFRWFTYVVAIGGTICAVLFSFVAVAADGYNTDLQYTTDLNGTLDHSYWFQKAPLSWFSKTAVSCQPALLTTGSTYFTSNLGFTYAVDQLWREHSDQTQNRILPATAYQNALLDDCEVLLIEIDFLRKDQTRTNNWWSWSATTASATVSCSFQTSSGGVRANLTTQIPSVFQLTSAVGVQSLVLSTNISSHASIWFGAQFAFSWYKQLPLAMSYQQTPVDSPYGNSTWDSGTVVLTRNTAVNDYTDLNFFFCDANFYSSTGGLAWIHPPNTTADWADPAKNADYHLPNITTTVDTFAKSLYSLILSEFGVQDRTNALITPSGVKWLESQVDVALRGQVNTAFGITYSGRPESIPNALNKTGPPYPINSAYQSVVSALGAPPDLKSANASTIFMQYLCSIPQRKGGGALFFAILLADLVFLQAVWTLLNLGATWWLQRKFEQANYCDGCRNVVSPSLKRKVSDDQYLRVNTTASSSVMLPAIERSGSGAYARERSGRVDGQDET